MSQLQDCIYAPLPPFLSLHLYQVPAFVSLCLCPSSIIWDHFSMSHPHHLWPWVYVSALSLVNFFYVPGHHFWTCLYVPVPSFGGHTVLLLLKSLLWKGEGSYGYHIGRYLCDGWGKFEYGHFEQSLTYNVPEVCLSSWQLLSVQNAHTDRVLCSNSELRIWMGERPSPSCYSPQGPWTSIQNHGHFHTLYSYLKEGEPTSSVISQWFWLKWMLGMSRNNDFFRVFLVFLIGCDQWVPFRGLCKEIRVKHFLQMLQPTISKKWTYCVSKVALYPVPSLVHLIC